MGIYWLTQKDVSSRNFGITYRMYNVITFPLLATFHRNSLYRTYRGINLPWFSEFHRTSLLWIGCPLLPICITSIKKKLWDGDERVLGSVPYQVCIWGVLQYSLNIRSEFTQFSPLKLFGKVVGQHFSRRSIFDLQVPHRYSILNQSLSDAYVLFPIST